MTRIANIWQSLMSEANALVSAKALLRMVILSAFICGQIVTAAHSHANENDHDQVHEHHHEPHHEQEEKQHRGPCQLCTLGATEENFDDNLDFSEILDGPDFLNLRAVMSANQINAVQITRYFQVSNKQNARVTSHLLDAARAPPLG